MKRAQSEQIVPGPFRKRNILADDRLDVCAGKYFFDNIFWNKWQSLLFLLLIFLGFLLAFFLGVRLALSGDNSLDGASLELDGRVGDR